MQLSHPSTRCCLSLTLLPEPFVNKVALLGISLSLKHTLRGVWPAVRVCVCLIPIALWESILLSSGEWLPLTRSWYYKLPTNLFTPYISEAQSLPLWLASVLSHFRPPFIMLSI